MKKVWVNDRIRQLEDERLQGIKRAEIAVRRLGEAGSWDGIKDDFIALTERNFLTDYCNEQLKSYYRAVMFSEFAKEITKNVQLPIPHPIVDDERPLDLGPARVE